MHVTARSIVPGVLSAFVLAVPGLALGSAAPAVRPAARALADEASVEGVVKSADPKAATFVLVGGGKDIVIRLDKDTKYVRDGADSKMADVVVANARVKVIHDDGLASRIEYLAAPPPVPAKPKAPAKPATPPTKPAKP